MVARTAAFTLPEDAANASHEPRAERDFVRIGRLK
jgi:hypothetical protein